MALIFHFSVSSHKSPFFPLKSLQCGILSLSVIQKL